MKIRDRILALVLACSLVVGNGCLANPINVMAEEAVEQSDVRVDVKEEYATDEANWSGSPVKDGNLLSFDIPAGSVVRNLNENAQIETGAFGYKVKTDANGRFGVAFNCSDDETFYAVYNDGNGGYFYRNAQGEVFTITENTETLQANKEYTINIVSNPYEVAVYVNNVLIGKAEGAEAYKNKGGIGLYNPTEETATYELRRCSVYETYYYFNDYEDAENLGEWKTGYSLGAETTASHVEEGSINGSGELKLDVYAEGTDYSVTYNKSTPRIANGIYEFDVINNVEDSWGRGRIIFLFRGDETGDAPSVTDETEDTYGGLFYNVGGTWIIYDKEAGMASTDEVFDGTAELTDLGTNHIRFEVQDSTITLYVDGTLVGSGEYNIPDGEGYFGIRKNWKAADIRLDNLKITETYTLPELVQDEEETPDDDPEETSGRVDITEDYATDEANWSGSPVKDGNLLSFEIPAGTVVRNLNKKAQIETGAFGYKVKTDANGRFGVAFNCSDDETFYAVYNDGNGKYFYRTAQGEKIAIAANAAILEPNTEYNVNIVSNAYDVTVYVDGKKIGKVEGAEAYKTKGGIGLYNPTGETVTYELRRCSVYETYYYFNDYEDASNIGNWETTNTKVSHVKEGSINNNGELKLQTSPISFAYDKNSPCITNGIYEFDVINNVDTGEGGGRIIFLFRGDGTDTYGGLFYNIESKWIVYEKEPGEPEKDELFNGTGNLSEATKHHVRFEVQDSVLTLYVDDVLIGSGEYNVPIRDGYFGIRKNYQAADIRLDNLKITETYVPKLDKEEIPITMEGQTMQVRMDEAFPRVLDYTLNGKTMKGNPDKTYGMEINSTLYYPTVSCVQKDNATLVYTLQVPEIDVTMKVQYQVVDNQLQMKFLSIEEEGSVQVETIRFADDVLFSTDPEDAAASMGTVYAANAHNSVKESLYPTLESAKEGESYHTYVTLASDGLAATVNNSALETGSRVRVEFAKVDGKLIGKAGNGQLDYHRPDVTNKEDLELPWATVLLCEDYNEDGDVNWQDAAASYKSIRDEVYGVDQMKNNLMWIAYNSGSQVQEPFYKSLDMVRTFYNYTDGFGQMIMHKGYQAEGHDDSHADYGGHVGTRQGGEDAFNDIIERGEEYNAKFGVHINVDEHMLDSLSLNKDSLYTPYRSGWQHWDMAYYVNQYYDITSGNRDKNLDALKESLPNLNFVYVDIYGVNSPAGWMGDNLENALNSRGFIVGTEFAGPMEQGAAFTHWGNDLYYVNKGNSSIMMRYFKNDLDIFVSTALTLGNKLLGIGTWGGNTNIKEGVETFYDHVLLTKYLQHFDLLDYEDGQYAVFSENVRTEFNETGDKVILTCDGRKIAEWEYLGLDSEGAEATGGAKMLLPWFEGEEGEPNEADKLYHWNCDGGTTTWEVPENWTAYEGADVYRLTGENKEFIGTAAITDGKITLDAEVGVGYVLYPAGHAAPKVADDFGAGSYLSNPGFDTTDMSMWNVETENGGSAEVVLDEAYESMLHMEGESGSSAAISQTMEGLTPGKTYTAYLFADISENAALQMQVNAGGKSYVTEAEKSLITYYGITRYSGTSFQKVKVTFDVPENADSAELVLKGTFTGNGYIVLDDTRVWENETRSPQLTDEGMEEYVVYEDFENVEQGYGPFIGDGQNGTDWDNKVHLSEYRENSSQYLDYVADGNYSLHIIQENTGDTIRTNPNTVKLEPNTEYALGVEYITGVNGRYRMTVRNGADDVVLSYDFEPTSKIQNSHSLSSRKITKIFRTGDSDDYYVQIEVLDSSVKMWPEDPELGGYYERTFLSVDNFFISKEIEFTTTYVVDDTSTQITKTKGETPEIADPVKTGYVFKGWFTKEAGGEQVTEFENTQTVYAQFEKEAEWALLDAAYDVYKEFDTSAYTAESVKALEDALKAAEALKEQENIKNTEVEKAAVDIMKAAASLVVDTSDMDQALAAAQAKADAANELAERVQQEAADAQARAEETMKEALEMKQKYEELKEQLNQSEEAAKELEAAQAKAEEAMREALAAKEKYEELQKQLQQMTGSQTPETPETPSETLKEGQICQVGAYSYKIVSITERTVEVTGAVNTSLKKIKIRNTVKIEGNSYKVVSVSASAFKNCKKATTLVIGKNVMNIGKQAFAGCKKLKKITIKSKVLKKVGSQAFKGINSKAVIKVPSSKYKVYVKKLAKKGQSKSVKIIK